MILFFGFAMVYSLRKLADKKPAVVIGSNGVWDNSTAIAVGLIPWTDIIGISTMKAMKQEFVIIGVSNPEHYFGKQTNFLKRKSMQYNYSKYGSPISISVNTLKCETNELVGIIQEKLVERDRTNKQNNL